MLYPTQDAEELPIKEDEHGAIEPMLQRSP